MLTIDTDPRSLAAEYTQQAGGEMLQLLKAQLGAFDREERVWLSVLAFSALAFAILLATAF
jgi:hypothetical protein